MTNLFDADITVSVTEDDIHYGEPKCSNKCPVALAIKRALPNRVVEVDADKIVIDGMTLNGPPDMVSNFVEEFDKESGYDDFDRSDFEPFRFTLPAEGWE